MADQNARFLVHLKTIGRKPAGYRVAHLHLSGLPAAQKSRDHLSRAISILADAKNRNKDGEIFLMRNFDLLFVVKGMEPQLLQSTCEAVQQAFLSGQPAGFTNPYGEEGAFFTLFDLTTNYRPLLDWAEEVSGLAKAEKAEAGPKGVIDLVILARIKDEIHRTDIAPMLFNQPVYLIKDPGKTVVVFQEMYMSIQVLEERFCPGLSLTARRGLFTDLTEELDIVVLKSLADPAARPNRRRISLNVNIATLASAAFVKFDAELPAESRQGVVLEINRTDFLDNMRLFQELAPFLRDRGYRLLLDGLSMHNVGAFDFEGIDFDFAKIFWAGEAIADAVAERVIAKVKGREKPHFVLAHCDRAESFRFARKAGIHLVQGRLVDHMVKRGIPF